MKNMTYHTAYVALSLVILLSTGLMFPVTTGAAAVAGPGNALPVTGEWAQLGAGADQWHAFTYACDGSQIEVRVQTEPAGNVEFALWTPELIERWALGYYVEPVGRGSADPYAGGQLVWTGNFVTAGTYYVAVGSSGDRAGTSYYQIEVSGDGVSLSEPAATPAGASDLAMVQEEDGVNSAVPGEPQGRLVFQTSYGGTFYTINVDGTELQPVTNGIDPIWSPAGDQQIAFVRWEEPRGVWVVDVETGEEWRVFDWSETRYPSWSPGASQIVFSRQEGGAEEREVCRGGRCITLPATDHWRLGIVDTADGSFTEPSTEKKVALPPSWSPAPPEGGMNGDLIAYQGGHGLVVESADGQQSYQLTFDARDTSPAWSPGGESVVYLHRQHDHWEIYVVDVASGQQTRLTDTPLLADGTAANSVSPAWSPTGQYIAFLTDRTGEWEIWTMEAGGSNPQPLFDTELDGLRLEYAFAGERAIDWTR